VVVRADAQGRAVLDDATIDLPQGQFTAHFPAGVTIAWTGQGQLVIKGARSMSRKAPCRAQQTRSSIPCQARRTSP
jgi:hypothetical protein